MVSSGPSCRWANSILEKAGEIGYGRVAALAFVVIFVSNLFPFGSTSNVVTLSGFIFGREGGFAISYAAKLLAAIFVYLLGRTAMKSKMRGWLKSYPNADKILRAVETEGWPAIVALRMSPVPTVLVNYVFSISEVDLVAYVTASAFGIAPFVLRAVLLGSAARDISGGDSLQSSSAGLILAAVSTVIISVAAARVSKRMKSLVDTTDEEKSRSKPT